jgi:hypothetical protein
MGCESSDDCFFFEDCVEHWSGVCPGSCDLSTWFIYIVIGSCVGALFAVYFCLRCELCPLNKLLKRATGDGFSIFRNKGDTAATAAGTGGSADYNRQMSVTPTIAQFHQVVLMRSLSTEEY